MYDLHNRINVKRVLSPVSVSDDTAQVGEIIDRAGASAVEFLIQTGSLADANATFAVLLEESDAANMDAAASVGDADLIGTEALAGFQFDDDNECRKLGYKGKKRYLRLTITPTGNTGAALLSATCILGGLAAGPSANPPA